MAAPTAWSTRAATSSSTLGAAAHSPEASMNTPMPTKKVLRRPTRSAARPAGTSSAAKTTL
jgi:hypothetical protein